MESIETGVPVTFVGFGGEEKPMKTRTFPDGNAYAFNWELYLISAGIAPIMTYCYASLVGLAAGLQVPGGGRAMDLMAVAAVAVIMLAVKATANRTGWFWYRITERPEGNLTVATKHYPNGKSRQLPVLPE